MIESDESLALELLKVYFAGQGVSGCRCELNVSDPPDTVVIWDSGERWGVEVARVYQRVKKIGSDTNPVSSETVAASLRRFADELGKKTTRSRLRDYLLYLEMPGPFSPWKREFRWSDWKKSTESLIQKHIESGIEDELSFSGGVLLPGYKGQRWTVMIGNPMSELKSATASMLCHVIEDKTEHLQRWSGQYTKRWLLLLNCYPLAGDLEEVVSVVHQLARERVISAGFDGIFWSGYPDRTIRPIFLS